MSSIRTPADASGLPVSDSTVCITPISRYSIHANNAFARAHDPARQPSRPGPQRQRCCRTHRGGPFVHNASSSKASGSSTGSGDVPHTGIDVEITGVGTDLGYGRPPVVPVRRSGVHDLTLPEHTFEYKGLNMQVSGYCDTCSLAHTTAADGINQGPCPCRFSAFERPFSRPTVRRLRCPWIPG